MAMFIAHAVVTMGNFITSVPESESLDSFQRSYANVHGYLASVVIVIGLLGNMANIVVLTRPTMRSSINTILTGLAISDSLNMASYLPYLVHNVLLYPVLGNLENMTYTSAAIDYIYMIAGMTLQTMGIWITIVLAIFRSIAIQSPLRAHVYCSKKRASLVMVICIVMVLLTMGLPGIFSMAIAEIPAAEYGFWESNGTIWALTVAYETEEDILFQNIFSWSTAILHQFIPCLLLIIFSCRLIYLIRKSNRRRKSIASSFSKGLDVRQRNSNRTTRMLIVVVILFLITELSHSVLMVCSGLIDGFLQNVYDKLTLVTDMMSLINNGINFIIYCTMSAKFRKTFLEVFF